MTSLGKPITQRQLRVGEMIKQALGMLFIRDGAIIYNGKIGSIFREKNQAKQVSAGLECGITLKDFSDFQKNDIIEVYNSKITERRIWEAKNQVDP